MNTNRTKHRIRIFGILVGILAFSLTANKAAAQGAANNQKARAQQMERLKDFFQRLSENKKMVLSAGARNMFHVANNWSRLEQSAAQAQPGPGAAKSVAAHPNGLQISNPAQDYLTSRVSGFTQSETHGAWCGNNVLVGFNDSGSFWESAPAGTGLSFNGLARSTDRGHNFTDRGYLNPGPTTSDLLAGDPVLGCSSSSTFYYASLFERLFTSAISVSKSTDGGLTFGNPVVAVEKDGLSHFLDKHWLAVDPTNTNRLFLTYTDFEEVALSCGIDDRTAIEILQSTNGGATWSPPLVLREVCGAAAVQGSQVGVAPDGTVYVAWEEFDPGFATRSLWIRKSTDHGVTFSPRVKIDDVTYVGGQQCMLLQGSVRTFELPSMLVTTGLVAVAWNDGRNNASVRDDLCNGYRRSDIVARWSTDNGATWPNTQFAKINDGSSGDAYQPTLGVDQKTGAIAVCWYDRRNDPTNLMADRYCWATIAPQNIRVTGTSFPVVVGQDQLINPTYQGDYDVIITDFTKANSGFVLVWGDNALKNQDVIGLSTAP